MVKAVLLKQNKISRCLISTPHWIHHVALTLSDYPSPVIGAGKALRRANSGVTFASGETFPSRPDPKAVHVCSVFSELWENGGLQVS